MAIELDGASLQEGAMDGLTLLEVYVGAEKVWPTSVQITLGPGREARDQLRAAVADYKLDYQTVTEIPFDIELVGTGSTKDMFNGCYSLATAPTMDTSWVTDMTSMFQNCSSLTTAPTMNTSRVTVMTTMFYNCSSLTTAPTMDTSRVKSMSMMFAGCSSLTSVPDMSASGVTAAIGTFLQCSSLTDGNVRLISRNPFVDTTNMILGSGLTREPFYNSRGNPI